MMKIKLNGKIMEIDDNFCLSSLLSRLENLPLYFVVAVNYNCVVSQEYSKVQLKEGDEVEILSPMEGG